MLRHIITSSKQIHHFILPSSLRSTRHLDRSDVHFKAMSSLPTRPQITLTAEESKLCTLLVQCAEWVDKNPHLVDQLRLKDEQTGRWIGSERGEESVELRIAGGWVRDKLLGRNSDDIDVSTSPDPLTGLKFAMLFEQYLETIGQRELMGRLTKIEAKPEQSKHLETATAIVCGLSVDWVQQRGQEVYTEGSRIPTVAFGTPLEDAERRDLTINALFYNLRTKAIEDQTGKGLADLGLIPGSRKRIRTPLEPFRTFHDDPLRVIRAVRFAARFGRDFELNEDLVEAIAREEIRRALKDPKKISRERVGIELEKMLMDKDPFLAIELIERLNLHELIFLYERTKLHTSTSEDEEPTILPTSITIRAAEILTTLLSPSTSVYPALHPLLQLQITPSDASIPHSTYPPTPASSSAPTPVYPQTIKRLYLACALLPLSSAFVTERNKSIWLGEKIIREGLKWSANDCIFSRKLRDAQESISDKLNLTRGAMTRVEMGLLMRDSRVDDRAHSKWTISFLWSLIVEITRSSSDEEIKGIIDRYNSFISKAIDYGLDKKAFEPPLIDGKTVNSILPKTKNSPAMAGVMEMIVRYQLANPEATSESVSKWLVEDAQAQEEVDKLLSALFKQTKPKKKGAQAGMKGK